MGLYKYIRNAWKKPKERIPHRQERVIQLRREPAVLRVEKPTNIVRARQLGYSDVQGIFVVRVRVARGMRMRRRIVKGRRPKRAGQRMSAQKSAMRIAEERVCRVYRNCEVVNSYYVGEDGQNYWFEIILADRAHSRVLANKKYSHIVKQRGRAYRGLTSAGKRSRGLLVKKRG